MLKNYILQVHKNPQQVRRLIGALDDGNCFFFIHVDLKSDINDFTKEIFKENVFFIKKRYNCIWGDYSQVLSTISLIKEVLELNNKGFVIFLSGQDFPIVSKKQIDSFLTENQDCSFINFDGLEKDSLFYQQRIEAIKLNFSSKRNDFKLLYPIKEKNYRNLCSVIKSMLKSRAFNKDFFLVFSARKKPFTSFELGQPSWALNHKTVSMIYKYYLDNQRKLDLFFKNVLCADEVFFQSILLELQKNLIIKIRRSLMYTNWNRKDVPLPVLFKDDQKEDLNELKEASKNFLYARKFDIQDSSSILSYFEKMI